MRSNQITGGTPIRTPAAWQAMDWLVGPWWRCCVIAALACVLAEWWLDLRRRGAIQAENRNLLIRLVREPQAWFALLLLIAVAVPAYPGITSEKFLAVAVDQSASISKHARQASAAWVDRLRQVQPAERLAVVDFAGRVAVGKPAAGESGQDLGSLTSNPGRALRLAAALCPPGLVPQLVLISDGVQTTGDLFKSVTALNLPIDVLPLETWSEPEVCLAELVTTPAADSSHECILTVSVQSDHADHGTLRFWEGGQLLKAVPLALVKGRHSVRAADGTFGIAEDDPRGNLRGERFRARQ